MIIENKYFCPVMNDGFVELRRCRRCPFCQMPGINFLPIEKWKYACDHPDAKVYKQEAANG